MTNVLHPQSLQKLVERVCGMTLNILLLVSRGAEGKIWT